MQGLTYISDGTITTGTDVKGLFGPANASLVGKTYELSVTYNDFIGALHNSSATFEKQAGSIPGVVSVTINGVTLAVNVTISFGAMLYANNNRSYSALAGFQSGDDANGRTVYASLDMTSATPNVTGAALGPTSYTAVAGDIGSVNFRTSSPIATAVTTVLDASFTGQPTSTRVNYLIYPSSGVYGDVNGDGVVTCADLSIATSAIGKRTGQAGFLPTADIDGNGVIDIRDISAISRRLPAGTRC